MGSRETVSCKEDGARGAGGSLKGREAIPSHVEADLRGIEGND